MTNIYKYSVTYIDEFEDHEVRSDSGILAAESYGEAAEQVVKFYGEDYLCSIDGLYVCDQILCKDEVEELW